MLHLSIVLSDLHSLPPRLPPHLPPSSSSGLFFWLRDRLVSQRDTGDCCVQAQWLMGRSLISVIRSARHCPSTRFTNPDILKPHICFNTKLACRSHEISETAHRNHIFLQILSRVDLFFNPPGKWIRVDTRNWISSKTLTSRLLKQISGSICAHFLLFKNKTR